MLDIVVIRLTIPGFKQYSGCDAGLLLLAIETR